MCLYKHTNIGIIPQCSQLWFVEYIYIYIYSLITLWAVVINHWSPNQSATTESHQSLTAQHNVGLERLLVFQRAETLRAQRGTRGCDTFSLARSTARWTSWRKAIRRQMDMKMHGLTRLTKTPIPPSAHINGKGKTGSQPWFFFSEEKHIKNISRAFEVFLSKRHNLQSQLWWSI